VLSAQTRHPDPLAHALTRKVATGAPGSAEARQVAAGDGWRVVDIVCTSGPRDPSFEEDLPWTAISLVLSGTFCYRTRGPDSLMSPGSVVLGSAGRTFECSHAHGEGDRCLSFQFEPGLFERLARDAGASHASFEHDRLPPLRTLAPLTARARAALAQGDSFEEIALELAGTVLRVTSADPGRSPATGEATRVARALRRLEAHSDQPLTLTELARSAGLSRYHFLRVFKRVTGVTPHQWLLRARLRDAAHRLATSRTPVTDIALDVGFEDLSNFIRTFRAEFGVSPRTYRLGA
jgi:AraC family transcriptional regulator